MLALLDRTFELPWLLSDHHLLVVLWWTHVVMVRRFVLLERQLPDRLLGASTSGSSYLEAAYLCYRPPTLCQLLASCFPRAG